MREFMVPEIHFRGPGVIDPVERASDERCWGERGPSDIGSVEGGIRERGTGERGSGDRDTFKKLWCHWSRWESPKGGSGDICLGERFPCEKDPVQRRQCDIVPAETGLSDWGL